ncbi:hypothetical protein SDC9_175244 [bioreactor metagenome]|uniref:Uncharacterized protein n=1 Tax=bioreactor metagenome TaxID=1076179 RepID=A0A645GNN9_9ZZZZ
MPGLLGGIGSALLAGLLIGLLQYPARTEQRFQVLFRKLESIKLIPAVRQIILQTVHQGLRPLPVLGHSQRLLYGLNRICVLWVG